MVSAPSSSSLSSDSASCVETGKIDASTRWSVLFFGTSALAWLLLGTILALISSIKLHEPYFLDQFSVLTYGRLHAAGVNAFIYGWGFNAAFAVAFWLMARLSQAELRGSLLLVVAGHFWNIGATLGVAGIIIGDSTSVAWLEMPAYATPLLFVAYALIAVWAVLTFRFSKSSHVYISQWYLLAALFLFPWIYSTAQIMVVFAPVSGTVQSIVAAWYAKCLFGLWFAPIGLAAIYYFLPKLLGKLIRHYDIAMLGFWSLLIFSSWSGAAQLAGGPVPAWVQSVGIAASFMLLVPMVVIGINLHGTICGSCCAIERSPTLKFLAFGTMAFTFTLLVTALSAGGCLARLTHFTIFADVPTELGLYAFFTMVMAGSLYYILPRVLMVEWPANWLINAHLWFSTLGVVIYVVDLTLGGIAQGRLLDHASVPFLDTVKGTLPYLQVRSLALVVIIAGQLAFALNFALIVASSVLREKIAPMLPTLAAPKTEVSR